VYASRERAEDEAVSGGHDLVGEIELWGRIDSAGPESGEAGGEWARVKSLYLDSSIDNYESVREQLERLYEVPVLAWEAAAAKQRQPQLLRWMVLAGTLIAIAIMIHNTYRNLT
jgi:hypothetical protein